MGAIIIVSRSGESFQEPLIDAGHNSIDFRQRKTRRLWSITGCLRWAGFDANSKSSMRLINIKGSLVAPSFESCRSFPVHAAVLISARPRSLYWFHFARVADVIYLRGQTCPVCETTGSANRKLRANCSFKFNLLRSSVLHGKWMLYQPQFHNSADLLRWTTRTLHLLHRSRASTNLDFLSIDVLDVLSWSIKSLWGSFQGDLKLFRGTQGGI